MSRTRTREATDIDVGAAIAEARREIIEAEIRLTGLRALNDDYSPSATEALRAIVSSSQRHYDACDAGPGECRACSLAIYARQGLRSMGES